MPDTVKVFDRETALAEDRARAQVRRVRERGRRVKTSWRRVCRAMEGLPRDECAAIVRGLITLYPEAALPDEAVPLGSPL